MLPDEACAEVSRRCRAAEGESSEHRNHDGGAGHEATPAGGVEEGRARNVNGGAEGIRTPDLDTASVALYQLSYGPTARHPSED